MFKDSDSVVESLVSEPWVTLGFNIVESYGKPSVSASTLGFKCLRIRTLVELLSQV
jgi:hypothetical protein